MPKKIRYLRVNPAGNITAFVLSDVASDERVRVGRFLMALDPTIEQVGFVLHDDDGAIASLAMMGGEFCGNATRSFGLYVAMSERKSGTTTERVRVSGTTRPLDVLVNVEASRARVSLPPALEVKSVSFEGEHVLVVLEGICHLIVTDRLEDPDFVRRALAFLPSVVSSEAYGVLFLDLERLQMAPYVYVVSADTLYREGSCGSGSFAVATAYLEALDLGEKTVLLEQPSGAIELSAFHQEGGALVPAIGGVVEMSAPQDVLMP
ncbi:MAG: hypothetical protein PUJ57_01620 [Peptoniphilaceae bacterium]|nr:hypothetical protein [Peptoniphilaceae bacterium]MDY6085995.1 hypothetical protein [Peptoniphilaceae bacterium]